MPTGTPTTWARLGVRLATRALPSGTIRDRYRHEFMAELHGMTARQQAAATVGVLTHSLALRASVAGDPRKREAVAVTTQPITCKLNVHHVWRWYSTDDGERYRACARCHKEHPAQGNGPGDWVAPGFMG